MCDVNGFIYVGIHVDNLTLYTDLFARTSFLEACSVLWNVASSWHEHSHNYTAHPLLKLDPDELSSRFESWTSQLESVLQSKSVKAHPEVFSIACVLSEQIDSFEPSVTLCRYLKHPGFTEKYLNLLSKSLPFEFEYDPEMSLSGALKKLLPHVELVKTLGRRAEEEYSLSMFS